jgi:hypothetical protein
MMRVPVERTERLMGLRSAGFLRRTIAKRARALTANLDASELLSTVYPFSRLFLYP